MPPSIQKAINEAPGWFQKWWIAILASVVGVLVSVVLTGGYLFGMTALEVWRRQVSATEAGTVKLGDVEKEVSGLRADLQVVQVQTAILPELQKEVAHLTVRVAQIEARGILPGAEKEIASLKEALQGVREKLAVAPADVKAEVQARFDDLNKRLDKLERGQ